MKKGLLIAVVCATGLSSSARAVLIGWNFTDDDAVFDTGIPVNFSVGPFTIGNTLGTVSDPVNATSASSGYTGASGTGNIGNAVKTGALNPATSAFLSVIFTPTSGFSLALSDFDFGTRSTATGAQGFALRSSVDGFATDLFSGTIANDSVWSFKDNTFGTFTTANSDPLELRLFLYGGAGSPASGTINTRLDDISINVTSNVAPVPEPSQGIPLLVGICLACGLSRMRWSVLARG